MNELPKDLQKQNFYDALKKMQSVPGWEILEDQGLLALKSQTELPLVNIVWGDATAENIEKAISFFSKRSFYWMLAQGQSDSNLLNAGFKEPEISPEMVLNLDSYTLTESSPRIKVIEVKTDDDFHQWAKVASETFQFKPEHIEEFFHPLVKIAGDIPYLALYDNEPAATSLLYCDKQIAGIYAMSTRQKFRRKGLGVAAVQACIQTAKQTKTPYAVLYASQQGKLLYEKIGFQTVQILREYLFEG